MIKSFTENEKLGAIKALLSPHLLSDELKTEMGRFPTQSIIGLGQGGGRIAAELSRFGFPTFLLNSSKSDMDEHKHLIPNDRRIVTSSTEYPELEGTDKNAQLGYAIAKENLDKYKRVALDDAIQEAEFVWVTVSLGGGTGNGALKIALSLLSRVRENRALPGGKIPLGVICSLPSTDEKGSAFRRNALAGISLLQQLMNENKIGTTIVIDNEKMKDYYANNPLKTYGGTEIDAKSYSNMVIASSLAEISSLPLMDGRSVFDKTELLTTLSTPGWLSLSKHKELHNDDNLESVIKNLFENNEVLATNKVQNAVAGAVAVLYPSTKNISPKIADDVYSYTADLLHTKVNLAISKNSKLDSLTLYGLAVYPTPSIRIQQLREELDYWEKLEKEQEEAKKQAASSLGLDEFDDFFTSGTPTLKRKKVSLDDLSFDLEDEAKPRKAKVADLDDIDF
ncbi:cell division protein FtsZ [Neobacillus notoginsengisoli]|uniref:Cell division protein FtsZ n=1 Tax=Neobacillus notoginsengisoli TaxID=1578198 RepID=A0A417YQ16_9BACI|nr:cell division protein FtsZ [Neobacillus notoginsengisoli]RHW35969.1 cell division protein FtsZ [Neobacillus notoginsengisoli]